MRLLTAAKITAINGSAGAFVDVLDAGTDPLTGADMALIWLLLFNDTDQVLQLNYETGGVTIHGYLPIGHARVLDLNAARVGLVGKVRARSDAAVAPVGTLYAEGFAQ